MITESPLQGDENERVAVQLPAAPNRNAGQNTKFPPATSLVLLVAGQTTTGGWLGAGPQLWEIDMTRKQMEQIRILQNRLKADYEQAMKRHNDLIREGEAVLSVILHRELGLSVAETELMLDPYKGDTK